MSSESIDYSSFKLRCIDDEEIEYFFYDYYPGKKEEYIAYVPFVTEKNSKNELPKKWYFDKKAHAFEYFLNEIQKYINDKKVEINTGLRIEYCLTSEDKWIPIIDIKALGLEFYQAH